MEAARMSKSTVLLVEDEVLIRAILADALIDEGYEVVEAGHVLQAAAALGQNPIFDFLITDVDMPGALNGFDLAATVAKVAPSTKIIVTSGRRIAPDILSDWYFLPKPYSIDHMMELLREHTVTLGAPSKMIMAV
jgi:DNA-binding NtrC family response regulator